MARRPLLQYWHQGAPPPDIAVAMAQWQDRPRFAPQLFNAGSARRFLAEHFAADRAAAFDACRPPAMASDYFRAHAVLALGGLYMDAGWAPGPDLGPRLDAEMTRAPGLFFTTPLASIEGAFVAPLLGSAFTPVLNGFFCAEAGLPLLELFCRLITANIEARICEDLGYVTGILPLSLLIATRHFGGLEEFGAFFAPAAALDAALGAGLAGFVRFAEAQGYGRLHDAAQAVALTPLVAAPPWFRRRDIGQARASHWSHHQGSIFQP